MLAFLRKVPRQVLVVLDEAYDEYLPDVLREIIERSQPDGFTDNSWAGLGRESICYCDNCVRAFRSKTGRPLPACHTLRLHETTACARGKSSRFPAAGPPRPC